MDKNKILLGMSGGIDSTFCASRLLENFDLFGVYLVMHEHSNADAAANAARRLGIKLITADCTGEFARAVEDSFAAEYLAGRTPNPCVECNRHVKIKRLLEIADELGIEKIATGHYARIKQDGGRYYLAAAADEKKDQCYFLWQLTQNQLARIVFPLADIKKSDIKSGFEYPGEKIMGESQEICFIPDDDRIAYIERWIARKKAVGEPFAIPPPGDFISPEGRVLGTHKGIIHYTIGQRRGLGIALGVPHEVLAIDAAANTVTIAPKFDGRMAETEVLLTSVNCGFLSEENLLAGGFTLPLAAKLRYAAKKSPCRLVFYDPAAASAKIVLDSPPVISAAPGQSCVVYSTDPDGIEAEAFGAVIT